MEDGDGVVGVSDGDFGGVHGFVGAGGVTARYHAGAAGMDLGEPVTTVSIGVLEEFDY